MEKSETTAARGWMKSKRGGQIGSDRNVVEDVGLRWHTRGSVIHGPPGKNTKTVRQISPSLNKSWLQFNVHLKAHMAGDILSFSVRDTYEVAFCTGPTTL